MTKKCKTLQEKCADPENRSRRCNLRFFGVAEDSEKGNMLTFLPVFIREILGRESFDSPLVHIFPDMTPEVGKMRAAFTDIKRKLHDAGVSYSLFFPAKLVVTVKGERHSFDSPQAAESFYQQHVK
uniref:Uncharacterized protein n=1 Tax=Knipowitschia caucasica TaxID=637954 RepID=A0AAV2IXD3_KNICA